MPLSVSNSIVNLSNRPDSGKYMKEVNGLYRPFLSLQEAMDTWDFDYRSPGLTHLIGANIATAVEYWYQYGTSNENLVRKIAGSLYTSGAVANPTNSVDSIVYGSDIQSTLLKSSDQSSAADGVLRFSISGKFYDAVVTGPLRAANIKVVPNGSDQTSALNTAVAKSVVKHIVFDAPGTNVYVINGSVSLPNGLRVTVRGENSFAGSGSISGGIWDVEDNHQVWASTLSVTPANFSNGYAPAFAWGFIPGTGQDMTSPLQKAVNWAIASTKTKKVFISTTGVYYVTNLIICARIGEEYDVCSVTLEGAGNSLTQGVRFYNGNRDSAVIHVQKASGVDIVNISFDGVGPDIQDFVVAGSSQWSQAVGGGVLRTRSTSPHCLVSVDPFKKIGAENSTILSTADMYPGLTSYYTNVVHTGSTGLNLIDCCFGRAYVGVAVGLSGQANGEGIHIKGGFGIFVANMWAAGQLQSRENTIQHFYFLFGETFVGNIGWGKGTGDVPSVTGCNVNYLKYLFRLNGNFTFARFEGGYSEGVFSFGVSTGTVPVTFNRWNMTLVANDYGGRIRGRAVILAETGGTFSFTNGQILSANYFSPLPFRCEQVLFVNTRIEAGLPLTCDDSRFYDNIRFVNCIHFVAGKIYRLDSGRRNVMTDEALFYNPRESYLLPGGKVKSLDNRIFEQTGDMYDRFPARLDQYNSNYTVVVNSANQTLIFSAAEPGIFKIHDIVYTSGLIKNSNDTYSASPGCLGYVASVVGNTITLSDIPAGIVNGGSYQLFIIRIPRWVNRCLGNVVAGDSVITSVIRDAGGFEEGDTIKGAGIIPGTYIKAMTSDTITISTQPTSSGILVELYDARVKVTADDNTFKYSGGNYNYDILPVIWFVGDELQNVTADVARRGRYCIKAGRVGSANPPGWFYELGAAYAYPERQTHVAGSSVNIANQGKNIWLVVDPPSALTFLQIIMPSAPPDGQRVEISFGGTLKAGATVVNSLSIFAGGDQQFVEGFVYSSASVGDVIAYRYVAETDYWYRIE